MAVKAQEKKSQYRDPSQTKYIYELCHGTKLTIEIIKNNVITKGGKKGTRRAIRYSRSATSIWKDEQSNSGEHVILEPIIIEGELIVNIHEDPMLIEFLDMHPNNEANGGQTFRKRNVTKIAQENVDVEEFITDVRYKIKEKLSNVANQEEVRAIGRVLGYAEANYSDLNLLKKRLYEYINLNPYINAKKINDKFDDPVTKAMSNIRRAVDVGELVYSNSSNQVKWAGSQKHILVIPEGKEWLKHFAAYILSPDGFDVGKELDSIVSKL